jgi:sugar phosphate isomerase/epimerase
MATPNISLCGLSFPDTSLERDLEIASSVGAAGVSIVESKLEPKHEEAEKEMVAGARLAVPLAIPRTWTILPPLGGTFPVDPADPMVRIEQMASSISMLAGFGVVSVLLCTGPAGDLGEINARSIVVQGIRALAQVATEAGIRISVEPMREWFRPVRSIVCSLGETLELLDEIGRDDVGIIFDTWHLWDSPEVHRLVGEAAPLFDAVQIADFREPTRGLMDRVIAGDGVARIPRLLREVRAAGFNGWYDLEVLSDDGRFGSPYEDSLWKLDPHEFASRQVRGFLRCWQDSE